MSEQIIKKYAKISKKTKKHKKKEGKHWWNLETFYMFFAIAGDIWGAAAEGVAHRTSKTRQKGSENATQISGKKTAKSLNYYVFLHVFLLFCWRNFLIF